MGASGSRGGRPAWSHEVGVGSVELMPQMEALTGLLQGEGARRSDKRQITRLYVSPEVLESHGSQHFGDSRALF